MTAAKTYAQTHTLCPTCAGECDARYEERADGMYLVGACAVHGEFVDKIESDSRFFRQGYEQEYERPYEHLALPVTYHCNLACKYCYSMSNCGLELPEDRAQSTLLDIISKFQNNVTLIGGEPTMRSDLFDIISSAKADGFAGRLSIGTNGQKLRDITFVEKLREAGLDFVFLSLNDLAYEVSAPVYANKLVALENCRKVGLPVWLQRTVDDLAQLRSLPGLLEEYGSIVFKATVRAVKAFGVRRPEEDIFVSDIVRLLAPDGSYRKGLTPFNRLLHLSGKEVKVCSWVMDVDVVDPLDSKYLISDDTLTTFHRGMRMDEVLLASQDPRREVSAADDQGVRQSCSA